MDQRGLPHQADAAGTTPLPAARLQAWTQLAGRMAASSSIPSQPERTAA